jgi:addiction module HigA family antidote
MHSPPHPGLTIRDDVLPALGLNVTQAAAQLGVSRVAFSRMINGHAAIERGGEARLWLAEQSAYDMWQAAQRFKKKPMQVRPAPAF